jgi:hypothetical protein
MPTAIAIHLSPSDRKRLREIIYDRNSPQNHVWRAWVILGTAYGVDPIAITHVAELINAQVCRRRSHLTDEGRDQSLRRRSQ